LAKGKKRKHAHHKATVPAASKAPAPSDERPALSPRVLLAGVLLIVAIGGVAYAAFGSSSPTEEEPATDTAALRVPWVDPNGVSPIVGSIDVNPSDDSLWFSTNTGLFRVEPGGDRPEQVTGSLTTDSGTGDISEQLVIRFRGPDELVASGHPPAGAALPPALGMIASDDAGKTWSALAELGRADFHAIQIAGNAIVAGRYGEPAVSISTDGGESFEDRTPPAALVDLEVDPGNPDRWIGSTAEGMVTSDDQGRSWRQVEPVPNVRFSWPAGDTLYRIDPGGPVKVSSDGGRTWEDRGSTGGEPQAMFAETDEHLFVALIDGTIKESDDGGATWTDRVALPPG
jgi:hypothetical protein